MKNIILLLALLFIPLTSNLQQNFIQVTVSEDIELNAVEFTSIVTNSNSLTTAWEDSAEPLAAPNDIDSELAEKASSYTLEEITKLLTTEKFTFKVNYKMDDFEDAKADWEIEVTHPTLSDISRLNKLLKPAVGVTIERGGITYENVEVYYPKIYPTLLEKAKKRAQILASGAGNKLGGVIQVTEATIDIANSSNSQNYLRMIKEMIEFEKNGIRLTNLARIVLIYRFEML